jgi:GH35 family endo-1,4-beta-xylanase
MKAALSKIALIASVSLAMTFAVLVLSSTFIYAQAQGLKDVYSGYFKIGSVLNGTTVNNAAIKQLIIKEFNSITMENEMKPDATLAQSGHTNDDIKVQLNSGARNILQFCQENNIAVRGHTLVWHSQTPEWFFKDNFQNSGNWVTKAVMKQRMESYIKNLFALIKKDFPNVNLYAYDVVNEAVSDDANRTQNYGGAREPGYGSGKSPWVQVYGDNSFIKDAFTFAHQYAPPATKLFYNDYNEYWDHKRNSIVSTILTPLHNEGLLDGMGMQSHITADMATNAFTSLNSYRTALQMYANLGIEVQITELDIVRNDGDKQFTEQNQIDKYKGLFQIAIDNKNSVTAVVVWGPNDANSWVATDKNSGRSNYPLLFDASNSKKPAYDAVFSLAPALTSSSSRPSSSSATPPTCSLSGGSDYIAGSSIQPPTVSCAGGASASSARFNITGANDGGTPTSELNWNNTPPESNDFWNAGNGRVVRMYQVSCSGTVLNYGTATEKNGIVCGTINIAAQSSSSTTPIANHSPLATSHSPTYYSLKGEPLGNAKPSKPGIYIFKQGSSIQKIVVK